MSASDKPKASDVAVFLGARLFGDDMQVESVVPIDRLCPGALSFAAGYSQELEREINALPGAFVIACAEFKGKLSSPHVLSDAPRLDFLRVLKQFFAPRHTAGIHETAIIHPEARIGQDVTIGAFTVIGAAVDIGNDSVIHQGVIIEGKTHIGQRCVVKSNAVIGEEGFGFAFDEFGKPEHFPHIGRIEIEDDVWIGACTTVELATIDVTMIESNVKIDDLVQIGHNCRVGMNTLIMAGAIICGGAVIGTGCWIAPNTMVKEKVVIGPNAYTGLGAIVIEDVPDDMTVVGNPAKPIRRRSSS